MMGQKTLQQIAEHYADRIGSYALCAPPVELVTEAIQEALATVRSQPIAYGTLDPQQRLAVARGVCDCNQGRLPCTCKPLGGIYSNDPLECSGCASGCFRCRQESLPALSQVEP